MLFQIFIDIKSPASIVTLAYYCIMIYRQILTCLFLSFLMGALNAQKKINKSYAKEQTSSSLLQQARSLKEKNPTKAILLVEESINKAGKREKRQVEAEAYYLLGEIYERIGQNDLALQRYQEALSRTGDKKNTQGRALIHERMGIVFLKEDDDRRAEVSFNLCIQNSTEETTTLRCEEGLVDVKLLQKNNKAVEVALDSITSNYELDSISLAKVEARRSQNYIQQNNIPKANESYYNSLENLPKNVEVDKEAYQSILKAQDDLLKSDKNTTDDKIVLQNTIASNVDENIPKDIQLLENLQLAVTYEARNDLPSAAKYINNSKKLIRPETAPELSANVYKKSSELNQRLGKIAEAAEDVAFFNKLEQKKIDVLKNDLQQQIEIVKSQKQFDISQRDYSISKSNQTLMETQLFIQKLIIGFLTALIIGSLIFFYIQYKNVKEKRKANQKLLLKSLRTQMNPHFIFNALNSVNNFIAKNDEKAANKFLADFSRLMRKVLDYSQTDFISFEEEIELNELYLKLEHFRFRDKFDYTFENNIKQQAYQVDIPPMLIQPFIENAVWHGLRYKEGQGHLDISINEGPKHLLVNIKDDGIGREKSKALKTQNQKKYKSTGLQNVNKRIELINELYDKNYEISVSDLSSDTEDTGTIVEIKIPII